MCIGAAPVRRLKPAAIHGRSLRDQADSGPRECRAKNYSTTETQREGGRIAPTRYSFSSPSRLSLCLCPSVVDSFTASDTPGIPRFARHTGKVGPFRAGLVSVGSVRRFRCASPTATQSVALRATRSARPPRSPLVPCVLPLVSVFAVSHRSSLGTAVAFRARPLYK